MQLTQDVQAIINKKATEYSLLTIEEVEQNLSPLEDGINKQERLKYLQQSLDELATQYFITESRERKATLITIMITKSARIRQIWNSYLGE